MHRRSRSLADILGAIAAVTASLAGPGRAAWAFNPPVDSAGPLTVRIDGPTEVTQAGSSVPVQVLIENAADEEVRGTVRVAGIDGWRAAPAEAVAFAVAARGRASVRFAVTPADRTYNAHYPIHAHAEFDTAGRRHRAHAILVVEAKVPDPPRPTPAIAWRPIAVPADGGVDLTSLPVRRLVIQPFGQPPRAMPVGWSGADESTRGSMQPGVPVDRGGVRTAISMHPPWHGVAGTQWLEFPLALPAGRPARLRFANAIRDHDAPHGEPPSDGVTFRVRALAFDAPDGQLGQPIFERHTDAKVWQDGEADLGRFAGQTIRLQLESNPGPKNDTTCDQSYWAAPTVIAGTPPESAPFPPSADAVSQVLGAVSCAGQRYDVRIWPGRRGLLDTTVGFVAGERRLCFRGFGVRVLGDALENPLSAAVLAEATAEPAAGAYRVRHRMRSWAGTYDILGELRVDASALRAKWWMENAPAPQPWLVVHIEDVGVGPWSEPAARIYAGHGNVIERPQAFHLGFDGHQLATSYAGYEFDNGMAVLQAVDVPPQGLSVDPGSRQCSLHAPHAQTLTFIPTPDVWQAARAWHDINGLSASSGVEKLAGRFVFDLWAGQYAASAAALARAFRYGLTDAAVVWHNWQRWGYDNRLPDIFPPNPAYGTMEEFRGLVDVCRANGVLFAPHDNYIDYYPDADDYSYEHIAFNADGRPTRAWYNAGANAQAYRWRTDRLRPALERNVRLVREAFAPTAYFIDVWSSIGIYDSWTHDGRLIDRLYTRRTWGEAFAWIREQLGGDAPQISESGHDQLIGWLDGAQANHLRVEKPPTERFGWSVWPVACEDAERIPWFDAAHHDRFALHGAGYEGRYVAGLDAKQHGTYSDDYMGTEMLTGRPGMAERAFGRDVVRKYWLCQSVARTLALRRIEAVTFTDGDIHRQHVRWSGGGDVYVNRGKGDWSVGGRMLPPYGFHASIRTADGDVEAAVERRDGMTVEWSRSASALYVNARRSEGPPASVGPIATSGACRLTRDGDSLLVTPLPDGPKFTVRIRWDALPWRLPAPTEVEAIDESGRVLRKAPIRPADGEWTLECEPGTFAYRTSGKG